MHMKVMAEQFMLEGDKLIHRPTGATFWLGDKNMVCCEPGRLNLQTGDDYKLEELKDEAWRIMAIERTRLQTNVKKTTKKTSTQKGLDQAG
jgi:hypothetical protein